jgi:5-methylthioadenosine/S-adenosylhomocysteine deaminase
MLTLNGAKALLLDSEIGSLEVGKRADIVMFRINRPEWVPLFNPVSNLLLSSSGDAADTVIIDGKMVMENRRMSTLDEDDLLERAQKTAEDVADRTGTKVHGEPAWKIV